MLFSDVTVVPMDEERILEHRDVLVRSGLIESVTEASARPPPAGARIVDGRGLFLAPGLCDFHVHLYDVEGFVSYLSYGVTSVLDLDGEPWMLAAREEVRSGKRLGPALYVAGPTINGYPPGNPRFVAVETDSEARAAVRAEAASGFDVIKLYSGLSAAAWTAAAGEARDQKLSVVGHVAWDVGIARALAGGQAAIVHAEELQGWFRAAPDEASIRALTQQSPRAWQAELWR